MAGRTGLGLAESWERYVRAEVEKRVREEVERRVREGDPLLPHTAWPFGSRRKNRMVAPKVEGARKVGRIWIARQSAIEAYVRTHGLTAEEAKGDEEEDEIDRILKRRASA